jgi:5-methylcytosine-specific restriction endonuclease McrA
MSEIVSRERAIELGLKRYFNGAACVHGHVAERFVRDRYCVVCYQQKHNASAAEKRMGDGALPRPKSDEERSRRRKESLDRYYTKNKEKILEGQRRFRQLKPDRVMAIKRKWAKANRVSLRMKEHRRRARISGFIPKTFVFELMGMQRGKCALCGINCRSLFEVDHIVPLAAGGEHVKENLQILCPPCNRKKGAKDPIAHAQELGRLL